MAKKIDIKSIVMKTAAAGVGAAGAGMMNKIPFIASKSALVRGIIKIAAGVMIPHFLAKGKKDDFITEAGVGMMAVGSLELANATVFKANPISVSGVEDGSPMATLGSTYDQILMDDKNEVSGVEPVEGYMGI